MHSDREQPQAISDPALDELLAQASWPENDDESLRRLQARWQEISRTRTAWRISKGWLSAAAAVLVVCGGAWWVVQKPRPERVASNDSKNVEVRVLDSYSRPPTLREKLLVMDLIKPPATTRPTLEQASIALDEAIDEAAKSPVSEVSRKLLAQLSPRRIEVELTRRLPRANRERRVGITKLLSEIGTDRSAGLLLELYQHPETQEAARAGVLRLADEDFLAEMARDAAEQPRRVEAMAALLERGTPRAVSLFLSFVVDGRWADEALASIEQLKSPPTGLLFNELSNPRAEVRFAAARVLGKIDGPQTTRQLARCVEENVNRREALVALMSSDGKEAQAALARIQNDVSLNSLVRSLRGRVGVEERERGRF